MFETAIIGAYVAGAIPFGGALILLSRALWKYQLSLTPTNRNFETRAANIVRKIGLIVTALGLTGLSLFLLLMPAEVARNLNGLADQLGGLTGSSAEYEVPAPVEPTPEEIAPTPEDDGEPLTEGEPEYDCSIPEDDQDMATWTYCHDWS